MKQSSTFTTPIAALKMSIESNPDYLNQIVSAIAWYHNSETLTLEEIEGFLRDMAIDDLDPIVVREVYEHYRNSVDSNDHVGMKLSQGFKEKNEIT